MHRVTVNFDDSSAVTVEGFGPETILGAVSDAIYGHYRSRLDVPVANISIDLDRQLVPVDERNHLTGAFAPTGHTSGLT